VTGGKPYTRYNFYQLVGKVLQFNAKNEDTDTVNMDDGFLHLSHI
jgi:hypothetical protein